MDPWPDSISAALAGIYTGAGIALIIGHHPGWGWALMLLGLGTLWFAWQLAIAPFEED